MLEKIGIIIGLFGVMAADSESLLAPVSLIAVGAVLYLIGSRLEARHGK